MYCTTPPPSAMPRLLQEMAGRWCHRCVCLVLIIDVSELRFTLITLYQARALSTMGFSTSRTLDPSGGHDTKLELSMALSRKMVDIERKKRIEIKRENWVATDRLRDDIR